MEHEKETKLIDLMQYVTNMVYHARTQASEMTSEEFDKWAEDHIEGIKEYFLSSPSEDKNQVPGVTCCECLKAIEEILYNTYVAGNGGYAADFGPILFSQLVKLTGYDINKRKVCNI